MWMTSVVNINDVLEGHVVLDIECVDRLYLNAYVPNLQVGGQVERFCKDHLGQPIASPVVIEKIGNRFRREVKHFAEGGGIPILRLKKPDRSRWDDRKLDHVRPYLEAAEREHRYGVVAIVAAQEFQFVFSATKKTGSTNGVWFDWNKAERRVGTYYFYILDPELGLGFIKFCTYFPYPAKVWVNGHEWAKRQARRGRLSFSELANGFASCPKPERLQAICDAFGPDDVQGFFDRWIEVIPAPFTAADRRAGGGSCPCARSRYRGPSSSTTRAGPGGSLRPSSPTTSRSVGLTRSMLCSDATAVADLPASPSPPGSSVLGPRSRWTFATSIHESSST